MSRKLQEDETGEFIHMASTSSRRGLEDIFSNPYCHRTHEETSFNKGISDNFPLLRSQFPEDREEASRILKSEFPNCNPKDYSFNVTLNSN